MRRARREVAALAAEQARARVRGGDEQERGCCRWRRRRRGRGRGRGPRERVRRRRARDAAGLVKRECERVLARPAAGLTLALLNLAICPDHRVRVRAADACAMADADLVERGAGRGEASVQGGGGAQY